MLTTSLALGAILGALQTPAQFSADEKLAVVKYWSTPGRYATLPPKNYKAAGLWQVRLTVSGSTWLWNFNRARGVLMKPTSDITGKEERDKAWDAWIGAKFDYDRWQAGQVALAANSMVVGVVPTTPDTTVPSQEPPFPGPMPEDMTAFVRLPFAMTVSNTQVQSPPPGDPPLFAEAVVPMEHRIKFDDGTELTYQDNTKMRPRYPYYRFDRGIISAGKRDLEGGAGIRYQAYRYRLQKRRPFR